MPDEALNSDGVHLLPGKEAVLADPIASTLETWRQATQGEGPTGCAGAVTAAVRRLTAVL